MIKKRVFSTWIFIVFKLKTVFSILNNINEIPLKTYLNRVFVNEPRHGEKITI